MARIKIGNVRHPIEYLKQLFAPASYGWGEGSPAAQFNASNVDRTAVLVWVGEDMPTNDSAWLCEFYATSFDGSGNYGHMVATCQGGVAKGCVCIRLKENGVWSEWEWVNPPMIANVEYRTTERCKGKVVYRKRVSFKLASSTSSKFTVPHEISDFDSLVKHHAVLQYKFPLPYTHNGNTTWVSEVNDTNIVVSNTGQAWDTSYTWEFELYYTKD